MAAPPKPWERGAGQHNQGSFSSVGDFGPTLVSQHSSTSGLPIPGSSSAGPAVSRAPPPLPTRPSQQGSAFSSPVNRYGGLGYGNSYGSGYGGFGNSMGGYGGMYGGSGLYGGGSYGGGMFGGGGHFGQGQFGRGGDPAGYNQFLRQAEENSRPAFQSIESIVQAFGSISMMMESTLQTVYNSFRAVIGVADHFSRLKVHLAHIFTALALFRTLRYIYRRLLAFLGLRSREFAEELWEKAEGTTEELVGKMEKLNGKKKKGAPSWPIFMFFAVVVGGPYIIWKLLCSTEDDTQDQPAWASGEEDHVVARAEFDFEAEGSNELSFKAGSMINLAPKEMQPKVRGWVLASVDGQSTGLVPANYIKILGKRRGQKSLAGLEVQPGESTQQPETIPEKPVVVSSTGQPGSTGQPALPTTQSELNLAAFDKAFTEAPSSSQAAEGAVQSSMDTEWSAWESNQIGDTTDKTTEEVDSLENTST
ncbi:peroxisomal membrane protein PEX13-like isoform X1 [Patiria miniata]|uniref:Peroxisomal membrane protein PEX13 n=1 Tax=Patiria miniata TaxID=46514 RepID=A0A914A2N2_PATMI|nr:peroxisomal membrane protein PEX13-like isoform X1 [Patiria miniata]